MDKYPKSDGALFVNEQRTNDKQPNWKGNLKLTGDQIRALIEMGKAGEEVKLQLGAWNRVSQNGNEYVYISAEAYRKNAADVHHQNVKMQPTITENKVAHDDIPF